MASTDKQTYGKEQSQDQSYWQGMYQPEARAASTRSQAAGTRNYAQAVLAPKDHVVAALLAIFLGFLGMHKFYLGYYQTGFVMMAISVVGSIFTLGLASAVMGVIAIIEGFIYLSKSQSEFDRIYVSGRKDWF